MKAQQIVNCLLEIKDSSFLAKPISGVEWNGRKYVFYPYIGPVRGKNGSLYGLVKTRNGNVHGRMYWKGQFILFEPADDSTFAIQPDWNWHKSLLPG